jgi:hypothetical protein
LTNVIPETPERSASPQLPDVLSEVAMANVFGFAVFNMFTRVSEICLRNKGHSNRYFVCPHLSHLNNIADAERINSHWALVSREGEAWLIPPGHLQTLAEGSTFEAGGN